MNDMCLKRHPLRSTPDGFNLAVRVLRYLAGLPVTVDSTPLPSQLILKPLDFLLKPE